MPAWFDWKLRDQYTGFAPELFFEVVDPSWKRPDHHPVTSGADIENELRPYAEELRRHGKPLRFGDQAVFAQMEDRTRRRLIAIYLKDWSSFVERVRLGFDGAVTDYVAGIVARSQLQAVLETWKGERAADPLPEIQRIDRIFDQSTEPLRWRTDRNLLLPSPTARRWWRRPKWLTGSLRDYFTQMTD
jgi:hypothetical protein